MFAEMRGYRIYYDAKGDGEAILFIHGTPTSSSLWRKQIDALSELYRVYALDLPGWARSGKPENFDYKLESYADILEQFLKKIGEEKVSLGIHDLGAAIGLTFLERHPEMVSKLILFDTFAYMRPSMRFAWKTLYSFFFRIPLLGDLFHRLVWVIGVRWTDSFATLAFYDKRLATKELVEKYRELARGSREADYKTIVGNSLDGITGAVEKKSLKVIVPTLILWAENDMLFPTSAAEKLHKNIAGSVLKTIPGCGHWLQEEKPDQVNQYILDFLK
jgi:haloalkane dehalogenase